MKKVLLTLFVSLFASASYANIVVQTGGGEDVCTNLQGNWAGKGTVIAAKVIKCDYHGAVTVVNTGTGAFNMHVELSRDTGICPAKETLDLPGTCSNGAILLKTDSANLTGELSDNGKAAKVNGTVSFLVGKTPVTAEVQNLRLIKQ